MKKRAFLLSSIFFLLCFLPVISRAQSQWTWSNPIPQGNMLWDVFFRDDSQGWAVGGAGMILHTINGGQSWAIQNSSTSNTLRAISFPTSEVGYIVGEKIMLKTTDGGQNWQVLATAPPVGGYVICFVDENIGWVSSGSVWSTHDGGLTWAMYQMPDPYWVNGLHFVDTMVGFWAGFGGLQKTTDGGKSWQRLWNVPSIYQYYDVYFFDHNIGFAIGSTGTIIKTLDGGDTWSQTATLGGSSTWRLHFKNPNLGWAVHSAGGMYRTENSGQSWNLLTNDSYREVSFPSTTGYGVGENGKMAKTSDNGTTWQPCYQRMQSTFSFYLPFFNDPQLGWLIGDDNCIYNTSDGGRSWILLSKPSISYFSRLIFLDRKSGWITAGRKIMSSMDGGLNWQTRYTHAYQDFYDIQFLGANIGWAVGETVMQTVDAGKTWYDLGTPDYNAFQLRSVCFVTPQKGWVIGFTGSDFYKTQNGGDLWTKIVLSSPSNLKLIRFADEHHGFIMAENTIYRTINGGETWSVCYQNDNAYLTDLSIVNPRQVRIAASGRGTFKSVVLCSDDSGQTWYEDALPLDSGPEQLYFTDANHGIVIRGVSILQYHGTSPIPAFATGLIATAQSETMITVDWHDNANNETGYYIYRSDSLTGRFRLYDSLAADSRYYEDTSVTPQTVFWYRVAPYNSDGHAGWSREDSARTPAVTLAAPLLSEPVDGATIANVNPYLFWTAVTGSSSYHLQVATDSAFQTLVYESYSLTDTKIKLLSFPINQIFYWHVQAMNGGIGGKWSEVWHFYTPGPSIPLLRSPADGDAKIEIKPELRWKAGIDARIYHVQVSLDQSFNNLVVNDSSLTSSPFEIGPLKYQTTYYWRVAAKWTVPERGVWSAVWQFTTIRRPDWLLMTSGTSTWLNDVWFIDQRNGWVAGDSGLILHTVDGGESWIKQHSPTNSSLNSIFFANDQIAWIGGNEASLLKSDDGGQTWQLQPAISTKDDAFYSIFFTSPSRGWIGGIKGLLHTDNNGITWRKQGELSGWTTMVKFFTHALGWHLQTWGVFKTEDGGSHWQHKSTFSTDANSLFIVDENIIWSAGMGLHITRNGGSTWEWIEGGYGKCIIFIDSLCGWNSDSYDIKKTVDGGVSWLAEDILQSNLGMSNPAGQLFFIGAGDTLYGWSAGPHGSILRTKRRRGDLLFKPVLIAPENGVADLSASPLLQWQSCQGAQAYRLQMTSDPSFRILNKDTLVNSTSWHCPEVEKGIAYYWRVKAVADTRTSWWSFPWQFQITCAKRDTIRWHDLAYDDSDWKSGPTPIGYGSSVGIKTTSASAITVYFRKAFDIANTSTLSGLGLMVRGCDGAIAYLNGHEMARINFSEGEKILYETMTATPMNMNKMVPINASNGIQFLRSGKNILCVEIHTYNPATVGISFDSQLIDDKYTILFELGSDWKYYDSGHLPGNQYRDSGTGVEPIRVAQYPHSAQLLQNYPNPFNPTTSIEFSLPASENVTITLYSLLGEEISQLVNGPFTAGRHLIIWHSGDLANGVYLYVLKAGKYREVRKAIVLK